MNYLKKVVFTTSFIVFSINTFAIDNQSCSEFYRVSSGNREKICVYNGDNAASYAHNYYEDKEQEISPFGMYENNCTNFVSQAILAGFTKKQDINSVYDYREKFQADRYELIPWYYDSKWVKSESWAGANALYNYAKSNKETTPPFKYSGVMFQFVTRDYISSYMPDGKTKRQNGGALEVSKIRPGDIIFMDYKSNDGTLYKTIYDRGTPKYSIKTDGKMEHSLIVTKITSNEPTRYSQIKVASSTNEFEDKLSNVNSRPKYGNLVEFHVYRPILYVEKGFYLFLS